MDVDPRPETGEDSLEPQTVNHRLRKRRELQLRAGYSMSGCYIERLTPLGVHAGRTVPFVNQPASFTQARYGRQLENVQDSGRDTRFH